MYKHVSKAPQCNLGILDLKTNKNLHRLVTPTIPNSDETKDQFRIRSGTKRSLRSHVSETVMAPKLHTSQIFKGRAYQLKFRVYGFCLNKQHACKFTLVSRSDFFETRKKLLHS